MQTFHDLSKAVAAEVRAEMARQRKTTAELAEILEVTPHTAGRRVAGDVAFDIPDLYAIAAWLGVSPERFIMDAEAAS